MKLIRSKTLSEVFRFIRKQNGHSAFWREKFYYKKEVYFLFLVFFSLVKERKFSRPSRIISHFLRLNLEHIHTHTHQLLDIIISIVTTTTIADYYGCVLLWLLGIPYHPFFHNGSSGSLSLLATMIFIFIC